MRQILWGLFKKVVIADNCAPYVNRIFENPGEHTGSALLLGIILFSFQIYGDFSGYSDIAIGTGRLFGINLCQNFAFPYFSRDIAEFWRRWHISLSTWFRDYVYIPLGGSRRGTLFNLRNVAIVFLVSGFWHGANWTFICWGGLNALYFIPLLLLKKHRTHLDNVSEGRWLPSLREFFQILLTFAMVTLSWVFFRADSVGEAIQYLTNIASPTLFLSPDTMPADTVFILLSAFILIEWLGRTHRYALEPLQSWKKPLRWVVYYALVIIIFMYRGGEQEFIYFQF
jgi:D-alanyl-lipoteichoic acid acyltransferase DltB (MBOAT superfamily)